MKEGHQVVYQSRISLREMTIARQFCFANFVISRSEMRLFNSRVAALIFFAAKATHDHAKNAARPCGNAFAK